MLKMKCPSCDRYISSALLVEMETVFCEHCRQTVPVDNLLISARGFTIHRDDLMKRIFRYQKLLGEVVKERELMERSADICAESKKSVDRFIAALEELMDGARKHYRLHFTQHVPVRFGFDQQVQSGCLVNLSMEGACLSPAETAPLPKAKGPISLEFSLPGQTEAFSLTGSVAWVRTGKGGKAPGHGIGVRFSGLDETDRAELWQFIVASAQAEEAAKKS